MTLISSPYHHPDARRGRFAEHLWPVDGEDAQTVEEHWVLLEFLRARGITPESRPVKLVPPGPDFRCRIAGEDTFFELGEVLESTFAEGMALSVKRAGEKEVALSTGSTEEASAIPTASYDIVPKSRRAFGGNEALVRILEKKLKKQYEVPDGRRCELVLYYDRQTPWGPATFLSRHAGTWASLISKSCFERVWLFSHSDCRVMASFCVGFTGQLEKGHFDGNYDFDPGPFLALFPGVGDEPDTIRLVEPVVRPSKEMERILREEDQ